MEIGGRGFNRQLFSASPDGRGVRLFPLPALRLVL